jgi:hypothetical protein
MSVVVLIQGKFDFEWMWCGVVEERVYGGLRGYSSVLLWRDGQQI